MASTRHEATAKPFSISLGSKKSAASLPPRPKKRPHSSLAADASDSENEGAGQAEVVLGFDSSGATIGTTSQTQAPLVIGKQKNRDWRQEAERKKGRNLLPAEEQARRAGGVKTKDAPQEEEETERTWGLVVTKREDKDTEGEQATNGAEAIAALLGAQVEQEERKPQTADEEAIAALLGEQKADSGLIIPNAAAADERFGQRVTEGDVFRADVESRPDAASLADYGAVPVEDFGRALMRGMGWKEGMEIGRMKNVAIKDKGKKEERRAARLGIGAKELPQELAEPGAWGAGAKKGKKELSSFTPLVLKNKATGQTMTEDEYKAKQENQKLLLEDDRQDNKEDRGPGSGSRHRSRRDRDYDRDDRDRSSGHGHRDREPNYDRRHRDRDYDRRGRDDKRDNRRRDRDDYDDPQRYRERRYDNARRDDRSKRGDRHDDDRRRR